jgi:hypothetical protein
MPSPIPRKLGKSLRTLLPSLHDHCKQENFEDDAMIGLLFSPTGPTDFRVHAGISKLCHYGDQS